MGMNSSPILPVVRISSRVLSASYLLVCDAFRFLYLISPWGTNLKTDLQYEKQGREVESSRKNWRSRCMGVVEGAGNFPETIDHLLVSSVSGLVSEQVACWPNPPSN